MLVARAGRCLCVCSCAFCEPHYIAGVKERGREREREKQRETVREKQREIQRETDRQNETK